MTKRKQRSSKDEQRTRALIFAGGALLLAMVMCVSVVGGGALMFAGGGVALVLVLAAGALGLWWANQPQERGLSTRVDTGSLLVWVVALTTVLGAVGLASAALTVRGARGASLRESVR